MKNEEFPLRSLFFILHFSLFIIIVLHFSLFILHLLQIESLNL